MINETVKVHDKFSVEIKLGYEPRKDRKVSEFSIKTWLFIPSGLDINSSTYTKEDFYNDFNSNIRLITPTYLLRDIALGDHSVFQYLEEAFHKLANESNSKNEANYEYHIRMFHIITRSALRREIQHILQNELPEDRQYLIDEYISNVRKIGRHYRDLRRIVNVPTIQKEMFDYYLFGDEFMSNQFEQHSYYLHRGLQKMHHSDFELSKDEILRLVREEVAYKRSKGYLVVEDKAHDKNRWLVHRRGAFNKYFEGQLLLNSRKKKEGVLAMQILYSLAAGLAMIFGAALTFLFQKSLGTFTMPLFVALVIIYMLKDRIKDLSRLYLVGKINKRFFDHKTVIRVKGDEEIGWCKESFDFVREDTVPLRVMKHRDRSRIVDVESRGVGEKIIFYRKLLRLDRVALDNSYGDYNITGVVDIIRFNVSKFIQKMDNPEIPLYYLKDDDFEKISGEKVYFVNMIFRFKLDNQTSYRRYRIIFNRRGIKKVEKV
ncbi:hypothetical protein GQR60_05895 [Labilibaculum sp. A4]|uniref:Uncharacterized protein n=1 Tax=Labilibaculum euxinus TaxID=2686357 RepID=A0A425YD38_9BACT|nr:hypothetical protein [Labilibaculum euxinus]MDQ1770690.1 hypothetical protein [Labilibaculum euxinus]MUP37207.1 hypothetical protein [Labilibaculum euxinus]MVB06412.1 hypothetical protein [Labilibaculum euxinus]MWN75861.1 hypothetical protein [Labilibaculum euxinus]